MMKLALTLEADSVNVQALNRGRIVVDVDGIELAELINVVCDKGHSLRVVDESDRTSTDCTPPFASLTGIRCSTAHITAKDNAWLYSLSHQTSDVGESEWIHFTGGLNRLHATICCPDRHTLQYRAYHGKGQRLAVLAVASDQ